MQVQRIHTEVSYPTDGREPCVELQLEPIKVPNPHNGKLPKTFKLTVEQCDQLVHQLQHSRRLLTMMRSVENAMYVQGVSHDPRTSSETIGPSEPGSG